MVGTTQGTSSHPIASANLAHATFPLSTETLHPAWDDLELQLFLPLSPRGVQSYGLELGETSSLWPFVQ